MSGYVSATRNELKKKRDDLSLAKRGHDMLKNKLDELTKIYFNLICQTFSYKKESRENLLSTLDDFCLATSFQTSPEILREFMLLADILSIDFAEKNISGVVVPETQVNTKNIEDFPYAFASTNILLDDIIDKMKIDFLSLLQLSTLEQSCHILSKKIEELKVRVNYLELKKIPELEKEIAFIDMKIEEGNTYNTIRLLKAKELKKNN